MHLDKTQMLKKILWDKINVTKNALLFCRELHLIRVLLLICDSSTSWSKRFISVKVCLGFSIFYSVLLLIKVYIFVQQRAYFSTLKRHNFFQNKNNRKFTNRFAPRPLIFKLQQNNKKFENSLISAWVGAPEKLTWRQTFKHGKYKFWVSHVCSVVILSKYLTFLYLITYLFL